MNRKDQISTYDRAVEALKNNDNDVLEAALLAFDIDDAYYLEQVTIAIRNLLKRTNLTPQQIVGIGRALHGLSRLPLRTPGLDLHISLVDRVENDVSSYELYLTEDTFSTTSGGIAGSGFDRDAFSGTTFRVEPGSREYDGFYITVEEWANIFNEMKFAELEIEDLSDDSLLDWDHLDGSEFWKWIANHD